MGKILKRHGLGVKFSSVGAAISGLKTSKKVLELFADKAFLEQIKFGIATEYKKIPPNQVPKISGQAPKIAANTAKYPLGSPPFIPDLEKARLSALKIVVKPVPMSEDEVTECDKRAANPFDRNRVTAGVKYEAIWAEKAIEVCKEALMAISDPGFFEIIFSSEARRRLENNRLKYQLARAYYKAERFPAAKPLYQEAANDGYAAAQYMMGFIYEAGKAGVAKNFDTAFEWYQKAAKRNYAPAQTAVGRFFALGRGVTKNVASAANFYLSAVEQDEPHAGLYLGLLYGKGEGVAKDLGRSFQMYKFAADHGIPLAQNAVGLMYESGRGTKQNYPQAAHYFTRGANLGEAGAQVNLARFYTFGRGVKKDIKQTIKWFTQAANQGNVWAMEELSMIYGSNSGKYRGIPVAKLKYPSRAFGWALKAAKKGSAYAQGVVGSRYFFAEGRQRNYQKAVFWWRKSAKQGDLRGLVNMAAQYDKGHMVRRNRQKSMQYTRLVEKLCRDSKISRSPRYVDGCGINAKNMRIASRRRGSGGGNPCDDYIGIAGCGYGQIGNDAYLLGPYLQGR